MLRLLDFRFRPVTLVQIFSLVAAILVVAGLCGWISINLNTHRSFNTITVIVALMALIACIAVPMSYFFSRYIHRMESRLSVTRDRLSIALEAGKLGSYDLDLASGKMFTSAQCKENFGLPPDVPMDLDGLFAAIVPEHRERVTAAIESAVAQNHIYQAEYQIRWPDDTLHWIRASGRPQYSPAGKPKSITGITWKIGGKDGQAKEMERALEQARLANQTAELGMFDMDMVSHKLEWDDRCRFLFGITHSNAVDYDHDFLPGLHPDDRQKVEETVADSVNKAKSNGEYLAEYRTVGQADHKLRWIRAMGKVLFDEKDNPVRFIGSVLDITAQKEAETRKNDFIGMVSHELKTPLTSLKAYTQMLSMRAEKSGDEFMLGSLGKIESQVNKMSRMIRGFLDVSRLESGNILLEKSEFDLCTLVTEIIAESNFAINTHRFIFDHPESSIVIADREKIGHVLTNLLSNAAKYSPLGSEIVVQCKPAPGAATVAISDSGPGISPEDAKRLFDRFYRVENQNTRHIAGFGIGLYLSSQIIGLHQGKIWVESEPGKGSTFYFSLTSMQSE